MAKANLLVEIDKDAFDAFKAECNTLTVAAEKAAQAVREFHGEYDALVRRYHPIVYKLLCFVGKFRKEQE